MRELQEAIASALAGATAPSGDEAVARARDHLRGALLRVQGQSEPGVLALHAVSLSHYTVAGRANDDVPLHVQEEHFRLDASVDGVRSMGVALLQVPSIAGNLLAHANEPAVAALWKACARSLPRLLLRSLTFRNPDNLRLEVCGHTLVFLSSPGGGLVLDGRAIFEKPLLAALQRVRCPYAVVLTTDHASAWRSCLVDCERARVTFPERSHQKHRRVDLKVTALDTTGVHFQGSQQGALHVRYEDFAWDPMLPFEMARTDDAKQPDPW